MKQRRIGDVEVSAIGLGGMPMSIEGRPDRARAIATVRAAVDSGVTLIDTADSYHLHADDVGHNESLIAEALAGYGGDTSSVLVATKGGHLRPGDGSWTRDGSPEHLRQACEASPQRVCLAWMLATSPVVVPIPGASRPETIRDSATATELELTADELARLDAAVA